MIKHTIMEIKCQTAKLHTQPAYGAAFVISLLVYRDATTDNNVMSLSPFIPLKQTVDSLDDSRLKAI